MIRKIADAGGVVGLNFCPSFLLEDWGHSSLDAIVRHACHLKQVGGAQVIAVGTDFGMHLPSKDYLEGMWSGNALRVLS